MFGSVQSSLASGKVRHFAVRQGNSPVSYGDAVRLWQSDEPFRAFFLSILSEVPFAAFRWETPPVTAATVGRSFEFVLIDTPGLERPANSRAFAEHAGSAGDRRVVTFPTLGNDAVLVVPRPEPKPADYGHLAAFVRNAPEAEQHELWAAVGAAVDLRLGKKPIWLSTAGMGVPWLHVRLDSRPKYYAFEPYRQAE